MHKFVNNNKLRVAAYIKDSEGIVTEDIDNILGTGKIVIADKTWAARSIDDSKIAKDTYVIVDSVNGVKAMVTTKDNISKGVKA